MSIIIIFCCIFVFVWILKEINKIADEVPNSKIGAAKEIFSAAISMEDTYNLLSDIANGTYNTSENEKGE